MTTALPAPPGRGAALARAGLAAAAQAAAAAALPVAACLLGVKGLESFRLVFVGVPLAFVAAAAAWRVARELEEPWPPVPPTWFYPDVRTQDEAAGCIDELNQFFWERDQCDG